jgi:ceramide glucosyltransferase
VALGAATVVASAGLLWWAAGTAIQWTSALLGRRRRPRLPVRHFASDFSIVAPMAGAADVSGPYVEALAALHRAGAEVLICVASSDDGAVAPLTEHWRRLQGGEPPLLIGTADTFNPKMNNVLKGLGAASRDVVVLCDAGIALDLEDLRNGASALSHVVGLVLVLKAGTVPGNFAAEMECAWLNGHQARFLLAADHLDLAVASGGVTLLARETLQRIGHWKGFNRWIADDYSVVRSVRDLGLGTVLGNDHVDLPLGRRDWLTVWRRQVRWARTRLRLPVWPLVALEPLIGAAFTGLAGGLGLAGLGAGTGMLCGFAVVHLASWLAAERWFLSGRGLPFGPRAALSALVREVLVPVVMAHALLGRTIHWRGADMGDTWRRVGSEEARRLTNGA